MIGTRLCHRDLAEQVHRRVVLDLAVLNHTAMPVIGVLAQTDVTDQEEIGDGPLHGACRLLDDPLLVVCLRAGRVLGLGQAEQDDPAEPEAARPLGVLHELVHGGLVHARERRHFPAHSLAVAHE